ncbi:serine/threonine-protein kinase ATM-like isoform X2 [Musa acuminata AAA Group]|uniref:serine/threonine-protein kinase ATM-like isoform X2 n=1 Tax=Musa acuminata AAA Group TaxID=214697 RepID=UPI0031DF659D
MATSRDVQEIVSKLSSDKAKAREEGVKLLSSWLEGERAASFCKLLGHNTAKIKADSIPHAETWPFLITLLMKCISLEVSASKKRLPRLIFVKTLRSSIQCAEDIKLSGRNFLLLSVVKVLFSHIWDVIKDIPSFQSEYSSILRHLLTVREYRYQMRKRVYSGLVVLYINKLGTVIDMNTSHTSSKEDVFRSIVILHVLLENPPGDYPDNIREDVVKGFIMIFSKIRNEGKILRKLVECLNTYLLRDGPNLGNQAMEIHFAVQDIMFRCWFTSHDQGLKSSLINFAKIQLKLIRYLAEGTQIIEQLLDVIVKELDQGINVGSEVLWNDISREDKLGTLGSIQQCLMELAATVFYQACKINSKSTCDVKRLKMEHAAVRLKDGLIKGSWIWNGAFAFFIHNYGLRLDKALLIYWFEGAGESLRRILSGSGTLHSHDALLWLLRALQEFSAVFPFFLHEEPSNSTSFTSNEVLLVKNGWQDIWSCLMRGIPSFSSFSSIIDAALTLLGNMIKRDQASVAVMPLDVWNLRIFKRMPSESTLYFIACYFSRAGANGDLRDILYLRKDLLRATMELFDFKQASFWNEQMVSLIPEAIFALCAGCATLAPLSGGLSMFTRPNKDCNKLFLVKDELEHPEEVLECSVESLAEIESESSTEEKTNWCSCVRLPKQIRRPLIHEFEEHISDFLTSKGEFGETVLSFFFSLCSLLCNSIYCSLLARLSEDKFLILPKVIDFLTEILDHIVSVIDDKCNEMSCDGSVNLSFILDSAGTNASSLRSLLSSPLFKLKDGDDCTDCVPLGRITQAVEKLLVAFAKLFDVLSKFPTDPVSDAEIQQLPISSVDSLQDSMAEFNVRIVDMELDADESFEDMDSVAMSGGRKLITSPLLWKLHLVSMISSFSSVLPFRTWEVLFDLMGRENDSKVCESILFNLCKYFPGPAGRSSALVIMIGKLTENDGNLKFFYVNILTCIRVLLGSLKSISSTGNNTKAIQCMDERMTDENLSTLCNTLNRVAEFGLPDWYARIELINCICCSVLLEPQSAQVMVGGLLVMLQDPDYRVRLFLARKIGLLFHTWDGHNELFHDICLNFGFKMVRGSKDLRIKAEDIIAAGPQPALAVETALITLAHLAFASEEIEIETVFMICVIAAMDPSHRELVYALFDNLSRRLQYASRCEYLEQLMGSILASWVACEVSLVALVEVQDLFIGKSDIKCFMQYCCPWLLPPLILNGDNAGLDWVSKVSLQPLSVLVREYFVPICALCIAVHCSMRPNKEIGGMALNNLILQFANISELERDELIKKHMVSIVSFLLSLSSCSVDPELPFFTKDTVVLAVQTVVDGFLEMDDHPITVGIIDKINIFRADRIFMFLLEMHYKISAAVHSRHICHRLTAVEVLTHIIGPRVTNPSSSYYIINIVGQLIGSQPLQEQCCVILSTLLKAFKAKPTKDVYNVLGEELQFLVSKLVACCIPSESQNVKAVPPPPAVISLLHELTVDADPLLLGYIRELEPFPEVDCLKKIRLFHNDLCKTYSARDHFLKFAKRAYYLPKGLLLWSLRNLHKRLLAGEIIEKRPNDMEKLCERTCWNDNPDVVSAVWVLVDLCSSNEASTMSGLLADFISRAGIGDPCRVVFHLPNGSSQNHTFLSSNLVCLKANRSYSNMEDSDEFLVYLLRLLKKFLADDSVETVDITSRTLRGILSTEKGYTALLSLDPYEKSLIAVHSKGVNLELVERVLLDLGKNCHEIVSLEDSSLWRTDNKTYKMWVCSLVHSFIHHCDDVILRLCQNLVLLKDEIAELLFPNVLVNLARSVHSDVLLCDIISAKVEENIFCESNGLVKSIQIMLDALNKLRSVYVSEIAGSLSTPVKHGRPSSGGKTRGISEISKYRSPNVSLSMSSWKKVYWLSIDYLMVAKAAIRCGSYFTAVMYVEHWCEEHFNGLQLGCPDFSQLELLPSHIDLLMAAYTQINEPDSIYGIIQSNQLTSQIITFEHEGNWSKALEYYDLLVRSASIGPGKHSVDDTLSSSHATEGRSCWKSYKGLMRSLQKTGCTHVLDVYCQGLTISNGCLQHDTEFADMQYEAAWRSGNWDFSFVSGDASPPYSTQFSSSGQFNENLHSCLRALYEGNASEFHGKLIDSKKELVLSIASASRESTEYIHSTIVKLQILDHLGVAWDIRWMSSHQVSTFYPKITDIACAPITPEKDQLGWLNAEWSVILRHTQLHLNLFEPFISFRRVLLHILDCTECAIEHLLESASTFRKGSRFSLAAASLHELKQLCCQMKQKPISQIYFHGRLEEAKLLKAQGRHDMAINLARYILQNHSMGEEMSNVYRLVGKWLAETRSSNSRIILEQYLKHSVELTELSKDTDEKYISKQCQTYYHLAHYTDSLFQSYEERLASSEWQAALRLREHKTRELDALIKRLKRSSKGEKTDYSAKIQELQKQLTMDREEAEKLHDDRDNFLGLALKGYQRCLLIGGKYDLKVVFRLVSLWFNFYSRQNVVEEMISTLKEVQSYKFIPLVYQIASRLGSSKDGQGSTNFQIALVSLIRKMAIDHPYHTIFQLLALANGDRVKDKQRSRNSFIVDMDKKLAAENLLSELSTYHGALIGQMKQLVEIYIKLAELETRKEETNKRVPLPREIRSLQQLELVPVVTATVPVDPSCQYREGSFPHFRSLADSIMVMNGINAPKVVECLGSDGQIYRQLAKSGNDDLRQDAVMEQFFGLVNNFLQNHRDTWKRRLRIRTYKVVPFTPSAGVLEWVDRTIPLGEYLLGSARNGGAHGRYGVGDWSFLRCREYMTNEKDKRKAFLKICDNFRPVMHYFFLEKFLQPADWFQSRLSYTRSVAASSMVGYIVGLGDRHSMNILIDQETAEVVHIDLGVAFEQGLMLKTPERVPFRLTRDIIDGMGVTGVEGVFRRCCEETLSVMRTNKEALLTIIEVFIHDPLYKWALSPLKALQRQKETDDGIDACLESSQDACEGNKDAARATLRVKEKLDGYEAGEIRSVQGQVQQLIQDAIDMDRLCHMFPGWAAWL